METTLEATLDLLLGPKCISSSTEWQEMAAVDLSPKPICLQDSCLHVCIGSQDLVVMLMKPFLGKNNRQAKAVSPPTHRPFVQTDSGHHLG